MNNVPKRTPVLSGVTVLTISTLMVKVVGLVYKIPLMHFLGAEGMGYFNSAYELYTLFFVIATAGLPVAVSILVSESVARGRMQNVRKIYRISLSLFLAVGVVGTLVLVLGATAFSQWIKSPRAAASIAFIAPALFFVSIASAVRGYFQGNQNMRPTAVSQIIEALGKLMFGVVLAAVAVRQGKSPEQAAAFAVLGLVMGSAASMLYLLITGKRAKNKNLAVDKTATDGACRIFHSLVALSVPVTVGASVSGLTRVVDMTLILRRLSDLGYDSIAANELFGSYSTLAIPIYHLPSALIAGIAVSLVPALSAVSGEAERETRDTLLHGALRLCCFVAVPCAFGLAVFSRPILSLLFVGEGQAIAVSAPLLSLLGAAVPSACLLTVTTAALQASKRAPLPIFSMLIGIVVKVASGYLLIGIPSVAMMGAPISTLLCNLTAVGMNLCFMEKNGVAAIGMGRILLRPAFAAAIATLISVGGYLLAIMRVGEAVAFLMALLLFAAVYVAMAVVVRAFSAPDIALILGKKKDEKRLLGE